jgi:thioredoxin reductase (NADPH)
VAWHGWQATNFSPEQIDRIRSVAQLRSVQAGEVLYEPSQPDVPLFIAMEGSVSISRAGEDDKILAVREACQFTGEISVISGKRPLLKARVAGDDGCGRARRSLLRFKGSDS